MSITLSRLDLELLKSVLDIQLLELHPSGDSPVVIDDPISRIYEVSKKLESLLFSHRDVQFDVIPQTLFIPSSEDDTIVHTKRMPSTYLNRRTKRSNKK